MIHVSISFRVDSLALGRSHHEATLKAMGKIGQWYTWKFLSTHLNNDFSYILLYIYTLHMYLMKFSLRPNGIFTRLGWVDVDFLTENKRSSIWQLCRYWWHRKLSFRQLAVPPVTTKLSNWRPFVFSGSTSDQATTKHSKAWTMCLILGMYSVYYASLNIEIFYEGWSYLFTTGCA